MKERKKWFKKVMALVLCIGMLSGMFDGFPLIGNFSVTVEAQGNGVQRKIDELKNMYPTNSYFSANGRACGSECNNSCNNCSLKNTIANRHPEFKSSNLTEAWSCYAFARFVYYYLFGIDTYSGKIDSEILYEGRQYQGWDEDPVFQLGEDGLGTIGHDAFFH